MSPPSGQTAGESAVPAPGLLILTGASHTGKTSVAEAILRKVTRPVAFLSVDEVLSRTLANRNAWAEIPLAYELLQPQVEILLDEGWLVIFESTFTYVPPKAPPQFHAGVLSRLVNAAKQRGIRYLVIQLSTPEGDVTSRARATGRLSTAVVKQTASLHESASFPQFTLRLDSANATPDQLAARALSELAAVS